jgi:hypothetical protein
MNTHLIIGKNQICGDAGFMVGCASVFFVAHVIHIIANLIFPSENIAPKKMCCEV